LDLVGFPLVSTSANRSGDPPATDPEEAAGIFGAGIDGWWDFQRPRPGPGEARASALVDCTSRPPAVLRVGPEPWPASLAALDWDSPER
jgi:tRNA A37 threonylcarbamoyladenosine synthetase subunit TsaC/SUA5/YrdC